MGGEGGGGWGWVGSGRLQAGRAHIPFRDSKLTFLLKNSLGGNARTTLLIAASGQAKVVKFHVSFM